MRVMKRPMKETKRPASKKKTAQEEGEECVQTTIEKLREKHGITFAPMQV